MKNLLIIASLIIGVSCKDDSKPSSSGVSTIEEKVVNSRHPHECTAESCRPLLMCANLALEPYIDVNNFNFCSQIIKADISRGKIPIEGATKLQESIENRHADFLNDIGSTGGDYNTYVANECSVDLRKELSLFARRIAHNSSDLAIENLREQILKRSRYEVNCFIKYNKREKHIGINELHDLAWAQDYSADNLPYEQFKPPVQMDLLINASSRSVTGCEIVHELHDSVYGVGSSPANYFITEKKVREAYQKNPILGLCKFLVYGRDSEDVSNAAIYSFKQITKRLLLVDLVADDQELEDYLSDVCPEEILSLTVDGEIYEPGALEVEIERDTEVGEYMVRRNIESCLLIKNSDLVLYGKNKGTLLKLKEGF